MAITPDTKERACPQCGYDSTTVGERDVADMLRDAINEWPAVLERQRRVLTREPVGDLPPELLLDLTHVYRWSPWRPQRQTTSTISSTQLPLRHNKLLRTQGVATTG